MYPGRLRIRSLIGTVAALGIAAMSAGPASAQQEVDARTGEIHQDCDRFDYNLPTDLSKFELRAYCRTSDDNSDRERTRIDLGANIGNSEGRLAWGGNSFQESCTTFDVEQHTGGVTLTTDCPGRRIHVGTPKETVERVTSSLELATYYKVNTDGEFEVK